jgi:catechol 2,3-dioxygenase-like lactoylglutathione lyase family enzyme
LTLMVTAFVPLAVAGGAIGTLIAAQVDRRPGDRGPGTDQYSTSNRIHRRLPPPRFDRPPPVSIVALSILIAAAVIARKLASVRTRCSEKSACDVKRGPRPGTSGAMAQQIVSGLAELTLEAGEIQSMEQFYCGVLGFEVLSRDDDRVWLAVGHKTRLGLWAPGSKEFGDRGGRHVHFALSTARGRLDEVADRLRDSGIEVRGPVEHPGGDRSIYFRDPVGNVVEAWDFFEHGSGARDGVGALR